MEAPALVGSLEDLSPPTPVVDGLLMRHVKHRDARFWVATIDLTKVQLDLVGQAGAPLPATFSSLQERLGAQGRRLLWGTNAGIFHKGYGPVGLFVQDHTLRHGLHTTGGSGNFGLLPNGVFYIDDGGAAVRTTEEVRERGTQGMRLATQSGPMLVRAGRIHHRLMPDSPNRLLRSGVGVSSGSVVHFAMSDGACRFHELATLFRDGLDAPDALYLDGVISQWVSPSMPPGETDGAYSGLFYVAR